MDHNNEWIRDEQDGLNEVEPEKEYSCTEQIEEDTDRVRTGMFSDIGKREYQQDTARVSESYVYIADRRIIGILCDGMGGLSGGELASGYCVEKLYEIFNTVNASEDIPRFYSLMIDKLDQQVKAMTNADGKPLGAGTTLVSVVIDDGRLFWASVGDSRIYLINDASTLCLTRDHNYRMVLESQVRKGLITAQDAMIHPKREALISYIGMGGVKCADISEKPFLLRGNDRLLLCSDGLYRSLSEEEMANIIRDAGDDMEGAARELVLTAIGKGKHHQDNTTAVVIKYLDM